MAGTYNGMIAMMLKQFLLLEVRVTNKSDNSFRPHRTLSRRAGALGY